MDCFDLDEPMREYGNVTPEVDLDGPMLEEHEDATRAELVTVDTKYSSLATLFAERVIDHVGDAVVDVGPAPPAGTHANTRSLHSTLRNLATSPSYGVGLGHSSWAERQTLTWATVVRKQAQGLETIRAAIQSWEMPWFTVQRSFDEGQHICCLPPDLQAVYYSWMMDKIRATRHLLQSDIEQLASE